MNTDTPFDRLSDLAARAIGKTQREAADGWRLARFRFTSAGADEQRILFVVGCQRSGTSMASQIFKRDPNTFVFNEISRLSSGDKLEGLRFDPLSDVARKLSATKAPLVIAKPLVESHRIHELAEAFPEARFLWLYRDYRGVAQSNLNRWGPTNGHRDLASIVAGDRTNWRSVGLSDPTRARVVELTQSGLTDEDAACLFSYTRNTLFFDQGLDQDDRVRRVCYRDLVTEPQRTVEGIYAFAELPAPDADLTGFISSSSIGRGADMALNPDVQRLCDEMWEQLNQE